MCRRSFILCHGAVSWQCVGVHLFCVMEQSPLQCEGVHLFCVMEQSSGNV